MAAEHVRIWRPGDEERVLLMAGQTTRYRIEPRGEYVFGVVTGRAMRASRGRDRYLVEPGQLVAWDPSDTHAGAAVDGRPWTARLMLVEVADLHALADDLDDLSNVAFATPVLSDRYLAASFLRLHRALEAPTTRLERDDTLAEWLHAVVDRHADRPRPATLTPRDDRALRLACEYLADRPERKVTLDELAAAAEIGKFSLIRVFRQRTGLAPHALQIAHRIRAARRLLEAGETIARTAAATGFADQSHLHRHFQASLGWTPGEYRRRMGPRRPPGETQ
jgi:AraC-like DNA-binding protein